MNRLATAVVVLCAACSGGPTSEEQLWDDTAAKIVDATTCTDLAEGWDVARRQMERNTDMAIQWAVLVDNAMSLGELLNC